jgi:hypothetical protein
MNKNNMKQLIDHFWFWLFLISIFLLLFTAYLCGGLNEINTWVWVCLAAGILVGFLAIFWASRWWYDERQIEENTHLPSVYITDSFPRENSLNKRPVKMFQDNASAASLPPSPITSSLNASQTFSPIGTPTPAQYNAPQMSRGFVQIKKPISSLV